MQTRLEISGKRNRLPFDGGLKQEGSHLSYPQHLGKLFQLGHQDLGFQTMGLALGPCYEWAHTSLLLARPLPLGSQAAEL